MPIGYEYEWAKMPDGTYKLFGVPVFQETVDTRGEEPKKYDKDFLVQVVRHHQKLEAENAHAPSVHWGHNSQWKGEKPKLGTAVNFRLGKLFGKTTIFVDIEDIPEEVFQLIKEGRLPHVSVEFLHSTPPRIGSIAILSSNAPYFTLPNIRAGKEVKAFEDGLITCFGFGESLEFVFKGATQMEEKLLEAPQNQDAAFQEDMPEEGGGVEERLSKLEEMVSSIVERLGALEQKLGEVSGESTAEAVAPAEEGEDQMAHGSFEPFLALKEEINSLRKEFKKVKDYTFELELEKEAERALRYFDSQGIVLDPDQFKQRLKEKVRKYGHQAGLEYIQEVEEMAARAPMAATQFSYTPQKPNPAFLEKYKEEGAEVYQKALEADKFYSENVSHFASMGLSREDFIEGEVSAIRLKKKGVL